MDMGGERGGDREIGREIERQIQGEKKDTKREKADRWKEGERNHIAALLLCLSPSC